MPEYLVTGRVLTISSSRSRAGHGGSSHQAGASQHKQKTTRLELEKVKRVILQLKEFLVILFYNFMMQKYSKPSYLFVCCTICGPDNEEWRYVKSCYT